MFLILLVNPNFPMSLRNNSLNILGHYPRSVFFKSILQVKVALIFENKHNFGKFGEINPRRGEEVPSFDFYSMA